MSLRFARMRLTAPTLRAFLAIQLVGILVVTLLSPVAANQQLVANPTSGGSGLGDRYFPDLGNGGYDAKHYQLTLHWTPKRQWLRGRMTMRARATKSLSDFNLDLDGLTVRKVIVNGKPATFARSDGELTITPAAPLAQGKLFSATVIYRGTPGLVKGGVDGGWFNRENYSFVAGEPTGASGWFPVNDHPADKATFHLDVNIPNGLVAASNGPLPTTTAKKGNRTNWKFRPDNLRAPYLTTLVIGDLEVVEEESVNGITIRNVAERSMANTLPKFHKQQRMIEVFSELFGPYPFETYGSVIVPDLLYFALETQTLSVFDGAIVSSSPRFLNSVIAHELAHQWFGNSLSVANWNEIWLNEGFASYAEALWFEAVDPKYDIDRAMRQLAGPYRATSPTVLPTPGQPGAADLFAGAVYDRGAVALHGLRRAIGDDAFFTGLRSYVKTNRDSNVTTADFVAALEAASGRQLDALVNDFVYAPKLPRDLGF